MATTRAPLFVSIVERAAASRQQHPDRLAAQIIEQAMASSVAIGIAVAVGMIDI